jgi:hypothetical protein
MRRDEIRRQEGRGASRRLEATQTSRSTKRTYQASPRATRKAPEAIRTTAWAIRTHNVEVMGQEANWTCRGEPRVVEGVQDRAKVVDGTEYDRIRPKSDGNARGVEPNPPCRDRGPGGDLGEQVESGDVEANQKRQSDGDGGDTDGIRGRMDSATSGAQRESKRLEMRPLAGNETGQHRQYKRTTSDIPRPSTTSPSSQVAHRLCRPTASTRTTQDEP